MVLATSYVTGDPDPAAALNTTNTKVNELEAAATASASATTAALAAKAPLASPALTGVPTVPTASPGTDTTQAASTAFVAAAQAAVQAQLPEYIFDTLTTQLVGSSSVSIAPNDTNNTFTFTSSGGSGANLSGGLVGDNATDNGPIMQAALAAGVQYFFLERGKTYYFNTSVFLDSTDVYSKVVIHGNGAKFRVGTGLYTTDAYSRDTTVKWLFFNNWKQSARVGTVVLGTDGDIVDANRATGASVGGLVRLYINDLTFDGNTARVGLSFGNRTAVHFKAVTLYRAYTLVSWTEYSDGNVLDHCQGRYESGPTDAYLVHQITQGDGLIITSPKVDPTIGVINATRCLGAVIDGNVTGKMTFTRCSGITINGWHMEGRDQGVAGLSLRNSQVVLNSPALYLRVDTSPVAMIEINDSTSSLDLPTDLSIFGGTVATDITGDTEVGALIGLTDYLSNTRVRAVGLTHYSLSAGLNNWTSGPGPRLSSPVSAMQTILNNSASRTAIASGSWELSRTRGAFRVKGIGHWEDTAQRVLADPVATSVTAKGAGTTGTLVNGTVYYYAVALRNAAGQYTTAVTGSTTAGTSRINELLLTIADHPCEVVVWRKVADPAVLTAATAYAVLPAGVDRLRLYDQGVRISGVPWITTSIPQPNTVAATNTTTAP